jgi:hypothetical protein
METNTVKCPSCGTVIPLTEALTGQIETKIKGQYDLLVKQQNDTVQQRLREVESAKVALDTEKREYCESVEAGVIVRLTAERAAIVEQERSRLQQEQAATTAFLMADNAVKDALVETLRKAELDLRRQAREAADKAAAAELEAARRLDTERAAIRQEAARLAEEGAALKLREKDSLLAQMTEQIEALKRKAETGSQEASGEAQEDILIETLSRSFPFDLFEEVAKGQRGGDIVQVVRNATGKNCGRILWESKNTKEFSKKWLEKVKTDQMAANANIAVIMTVSLPDDFTAAGMRFGLYENVWVTDLKSTVALTMAIRQGIIEANKQRVVSANQDSLKDLLYGYMTSKDTQLRITSVLDAVKRMEDDLAAERRAFERVWSCRAKQIEAINAGFGNFFGGIEGVIGRAALPEGPLEGIGEL